MRPSTRLISPSYGKPLHDICRGEIHRILNKAAPLDPARYRIDDDVIGTVKLRGTQSHFDGRIVVPEKVFILHLTTANLVSSEWDAIGRESGGKGFGEKRASPQLRS